MNENETNYIIIEQLSMFIWKQKQVRGSGIVWKRRIRFFKKKLRSGYVLEGYIYIYINIKIIFIKYMTKNI